MTVPCVDGHERPYVSLDAAASTAPLVSVADRVEEFLPWYSSIHRGAGYKSQAATAAYEAARSAAHAFAGRGELRGPGAAATSFARGDDIAIFCRNTTEAINVLAYRLALVETDVVVTTVVEHHANLLPWSRSATCRYVECGSDGTFGLEDVEAALDAKPRPRLLAITAASNITGWSPPLERIIRASHERGVPVAVDAAQLAPHRELPREADFVAWSGHKMYAPFGCGVLIGPRPVFEKGDPLLVGGGAVELVDLDEVIWTDPPDREEAGSPNVVGAVALHAAMDAITEIGWDRVAEHDRALARLLHQGLSSVPGVKLLGPEPGAQPIPVCTFVVEGMSHALVAARLSAEHAIGVRHGCFCAHPYLVRLLGLTSGEVASFRDEIARGDRRNMPGAIRASAGMNTTSQDVERFIVALSAITSGEKAPVAYVQDPNTGDYAPESDRYYSPRQLRSSGASCSRG